MNRLKSRIGISAATVVASLVAAVAIVVGLALLAAGVWGPGAGVPAPGSPGHLAAPPRISWAPCPSTAGYRCATVSVPVSYRHPGKATIPLAVSERPATDPVGPPGTLIFNPGGPGESGVQILPVLAALAPPAVARQFNLVSFDERGTGASERLACGPAPAAVAAVDPVPTRPGAPLPGTGLYRRLATSCQRAYPSLLAHIDTIDAARDMDRIRQAIGVDKISYWGLSYGTVLGSVYARMFPGHVRAMILDGAVNPTQPLAAQASQEAPAIVASLDHYFALCAATGCPLGPHPAASFRRLESTLERRPLPAPGGGDQVPVTVGDLATATLFALSVPTFAGTFSTALVDAAHGNGTKLRQLSLEFELDLNGTSLVGPQWAYTCNDASTRLGPVGAGQLASSIAGRDGLIGAYAVTYTLGGCVNWPRPGEPVTRVRVTSGPPLVVIGNTGDPNTPHRSAVGLAAALGRARLVTWVGWGHTWLLNGSSDPCMDQVVTSYLVDHRAPRSGTTCH
ncbi:MAG: alpha/beta hydrolase [Acidimicrobiales bacterium]